MPLTHPDNRCWAEIDLGAIGRNAAQLSQLAGGSPLVAVVKANAYGHGLVEVARAIDPLDTVAFFGVATAGEAAALVAEGLRKPPLLLFPVPPGDREAVVGLGATTVLSSTGEAEAYDQLARAAGRRLPVHLAIDTGMGRVGFLEDQALEAARAVAALPGLELDGVCSHLPSADCDQAFTKHQIDRFERLLAALLDAGHRPAWRHLANSPGVIGFPPPAGCNLARCGLALYGVSPVTDPGVLLEPALSLMAYVTLVRDLPPGHGVSYGRTFVTGRPTRVATLSIGYADGYPRHLSGSGATALVNGIPCPVLGRVTMDLVMVDVTALTPPPVPGDTAVLIGGTGEASVTATDLAGLAGTIPWEIFTRIGPRVERRYLAEPADLSDAR